MKVRIWHKEGKNWHLAKVSQADDLKILYKADKQIWSLVEIATDGRSIDVYLEPIQGLTRFFAEGD